MGVSTPALVSVFLSFSIDLGRDKNTSHSSASPQDWVSALPVRSLALRAPDPASLLSMHFLMSPELVSIELSPPGGSKQYLASKRELGVTELNDHLTPGICPFLRRLSRTLLGAGAH